MKRMQNKFILLSIVLCVLTSSCRKMVQDEFPYFEPKPNINSIIVSGDTIKFFVGLAQKLDKFPLSYINDASISLYENGIFIENISSGKNGSYISSHIAKENKIYTFEVDIPNFQKICCSTKTPISQKIITIKHFINGGKDTDGNTIPAIQIDFTNNPNEKLYYQIILWHSANYLNSPIRPLEVLNIQDPILLNESLPIEVFSNEKIKDSVYSMYLNYSTGSSSNNPYKLIVELRSIDEAYYRYLQSQYLYNNGRFENGIGEVYPNYQLYSNIEGGLGIVTSFSKILYEPMDISGQDKVSHPNTTTDDERK